MLLKKSRILGFSIPDATGVKLKEKVTDGTTITTTYYMDTSPKLSTGSFQYTYSALDLFPHAEGYAKAIPSGLGGGTSYTFKYVFSYTDHLGNIRVKYAQNPANGNQIEILEEDHYYPYGLKHIGYNGNHTTWDVTPGGQITLTPVNPFLGDTYKYKFGGKEYQTEFDINSYDFGARNYDPALGRWMNIDPLADQMRRHSPYNYAFDNPIYFIDYDGMAPDDYYIDSITGKLLGQDGAATNNIRSIDAGSFNSISTANGGTTSETATTELQSKGSLVNINQSKINSDLKAINNETVADQSAERQLYLTLSYVKDGDGNVARDNNGNYVQEVTSEIGSKGTDGVAIFETSPENSNGVRMRNGSIVLGGAHTHNKTSDPGKINIPTTSPDDANTANINKVTIYAIDSYTGTQSTSSSGPAIHRVTKDGTKTNNVGTTNNNNIGMDALKQHAGF